MFLINVTFVVEGDNRNIVSYTAVLTWIGSISTDILAATAPCNINIIDRSSASLPAQTYIYIPYARYDYMGRGMN